MPSVQETGSGRFERRSADPTISVVMPTLNEAENLPHVLTRLPSCVDELIIVDGRSVDDTVAVARRLRPDVNVVLQDGRGKGNALACGFRAARGDVIVMLDADGSTDPAEIPLFVGALLEGSDYAKGTRFAHGGASADITPLRRVGNGALCWLANRVLRARYTDLCYGYNAFWRDCLEQLHFTCDGFEVETQLNITAARAGLRISEVPSIEHCRLFGQSNLRTVRDGTRVLWTILRAARRRGAPARSRTADATVTVHAPRPLGDIAPGGVQVYRHAPPSAGARRSNPARKLASSSPIGR
jgi:glycosyltransferase involved in cell wall biosynthesis